MNQPVGDTSSVSALNPENSSAEVSLQNEDEIYREYSRRKHEDLLNKISDTIRQSDVHNTSQAAMQKAKSYQYEQSTFSRQQKSLKKPHSAVKHSQSSVYNRRAEIEAPSFGEEHFDPEEIRLESGASPQRSSKPSSASYSMLAQAQRRMRRQDDTSSPLASQSRHSNVNLNQKFLMANVSTTMVHDYQPKDRSINMTPNKR